MRGRLFLCAVAAFAVYLVGTLLILSPLQPQPPRPDDQSELPTPTSPYVVTSPSGLGQLRRGMRPAQSSPAGSSGGEADAGAGAAVSNPARVVGPDLWTPVPAPVPAPAPVSVPASVVGTSETTPLPTSHSGATTLLPCAQYPDNPANSPAWLSIAALASSPADVPVLQQHLQSVLPAQHAQSPLTGRVRQLVIDYSALTQLLSPAREPPKVPSVLPSPPPPPQAQAQLAAVIDRAHGPSCSVLGGLRHPPLRRTAAALAAIVSPHAMDPLLLLDALALLQLTQCEVALVLPPWARLCPAALMALPAAIRKADRNAPNWRALVMGRGLSGTLLRCSALPALAQHLRDALQALGNATAVPNAKQLVAQWLTAPRRHEPVAAHRYRLSTPVHPAPFECGVELGVDGGPLACIAFDSTACARTDLSPCAHSQADSLLHLTARAGVLQRAAIAAGPAAVRLPSPALPTNAQRVRGAAGQSCEQACAARRQQCSAPLLAALNTCDELRAVFGCTRCDVSEGPDQPCFVRADAPASVSSRGACLVKYDTASMSCAGSFVHAERLCACVP